MRSLTIAVGYAWGTSTIHDDKRWMVLRDFLCDAQTEARKRYKARIKSSGKIESDGYEITATQKPTGTGKIELDPTHDYRGRVTRLRATVGRNILDSIRTRIESADILVFDLTPRKGEKQPNSNVLLELGIAMARPMPVPVYAIVDDQTKRKKIIPSDLQGLIIGEVLSKEAKENGTRNKKCQDRSLRMAIVNELLRRLDEMDNEDMEGVNDVHIEGRAHSR